MGILREVTLHFIRQCFPSLFNTLHVSLSRGLVDSTDVLLSKSDPVSVFGIPLQVLDGKLSGLSLQLPWMNRHGAKFSVKVNYAHIHLAEIPFPSLQESVFNALSDEMRRKKFRLVAEVERSQAPFGSSIRHIISQVLERIELEMKDFTAVVEFADGFTGTFTVAKVLARRPEVSTEEQSRTLVVSIQDISATIRSSSGDAPVPLNIPNFSITLGIELDEGTLKVELDVSRTIEFSLHSSLRELVHSLKLRRARWWSAQKWGRPFSCARTDPVSWLRYAYRRVSASYGLLHVRLDSEKLRQSLQSFVEYKNLHVRRLTKSRLKVEEMNRIAELEESFDTELILLLRCAAKRDVAADEISRFGTSEWLRWILFGHKMSYERERLAADIQKSLEESTGTETTTNTAEEACGQDHHYGERYKFKCGLDGVVGRVCDGNHECEISLMGLGFDAELNSATGYYNVGFFLNDLILSLNGDIVARREPLLNDFGDEDDKTTQLTASFSYSSDAASSNVTMHSVSVTLCPSIVDSCSSVFKRWTSPLPPIVFDRKENWTEFYLKDKQPQYRSNFFSGIVCNTESVRVLLFEDNGIHNGRGPAFAVTMRQTTIRVPPSKTSYTLEVNSSLSLQGSEIDGHSGLTSFAATETGDSSFPSDVRQFVSFSTRFRFEWKHTATMKFDNAVGFVRIPSAVRIMNKLWGSRSSQVVESTSSEDDEIDVHCAPDSELDMSNVQDRFIQSGFHCVVSSLRVNILWDSHSLDDVFLLEMERWETKLSSPTFSLISTRIGKFSLSSSAKPFLLLIEASSNVEHAIRLKRGSHPQIHGRFFEVLIGDVSSQLCADVVLAVLALVSEMVETPSSSQKTIQRVSSSASDGRRSTTLLSLLAESLNVLWSDGLLRAEINCSDFQVTAEGNKISGSAETVTLTKVNATSSAAQEVILHVTESLRTLNSALRFVGEPAGLHIYLNNLTASTKRSFWDPLVLSIASVFETLKEWHDREDLSVFEGRQDEDKGLPITIDGAGIVIVLPISEPGSPQLLADVSRVIVLLQSGLQTLSFRRTEILISHADKKSHSPWRTKPEKCTRILQTDGFDLQHKSSVPLPDADPLVHYLDTWELTIPNSTALTLSPESLSALRNGFSDLLSACNDTEGTNATQSPTRTHADIPSNILGRTRVLFCGSIASLRLNVGIDRGGIADEPFAAIEAQEICLSSAQVSDRAGTDNCDVIVFSWFASCKIFHLFKYEASSPEPWRIAIGRDLKRLADTFPSPGHQGVSVRSVSRQDRGRYTTTFDIRISDASVLYDLDLYAKLSQFMTDCSRRLHPTGQEPSTNPENENRDHHPYGDKAVKCDSSPTHEASRSSSTSGDHAMASSHESSVKVNVLLGNFTFLCSLDEYSNLMYQVRLYILTMRSVLVMSSLLHPMNGSVVRLQGISFWVNANRLSARRRVGSTITEEQSLENRIHGTQGVSSNTVPYTQVPNSLSSSGCLPRAGFGEDELIATVGELSATLKRSPEEELVLSGANVHFDTSVRTVLHLAEILAHYGVNSSSGMETFSYTNFITPSRLRLHAQNVALRLTFDILPSARWDGNALRRGSMAVDLNVSLHNLTNTESQTSKGTVKLSLDISDNVSGHRDQLVSPSLLRYRVRKKGECAIEAEVRQLLRFAFSPLTVRMVSAFSAALQNSSVAAESTSDAQRAMPDTDLRLIIHIHGIAVRCLSDVPRIQVMRLLLGATRFDAAVSVESGIRLLDFSIREFLIEDTISWRLFRNDPTDSKSRRWERIVASVPQLDGRSGPLFPQSPQDLHTRYMRLRDAKAANRTGESTTCPALRCQLKWRHHFEDMKARIGSSGVDVNLDLVALPVIQEWYKSLLRELTPLDTPRASGPHALFDSGRPREIIEPWFSEVHLEPLSITGGIRAAPRRLQESLIERLLTLILNVDSVTGLALHLPGVHIRGKHESLVNLLHQVFSTYSLSTVSRELLWQILKQSRKLSRVARLLALSRFRQRPYNPLRTSAEKTEPLNANENRKAVGLLVALDSVANTSQSVVESSRALRRLVVQRVGSTVGIGPRIATLQPLSVPVVDLT